MTSKRDDARVIAIDLPAQWATAVPVDQAVYATDSGDPVMHLASLLLADGTSIFVLLYPGGERLARVSPHTDWGLEERLDGSPPSEEHQAAVDVAWRGWLEKLIRVGRFTAGLEREIAETEDDDE
jgi:hypothetical protein